MTPASDSEPTSEPDSERAVSERAVSERAVSERAVSERAVSERAVSERAVSERAVSERAVSERAVSERAAVQGSGPGAEAERDADVRSTVQADVHTDARAAARTHADVGPDLDPEVDGRLRAAFAEAAHDITPNPVPLAAVRRQGRAHRRRRAVAFAALAVLSVSGAATVARLSLPADHAVTLAPPVPRTPPASLPPSPRTPAAAAPGRADAPQVTEVRVVRSGERVDAGKGWTVWLTAGGKHWTGPDGYENSRSVTDGNVDTAAPGVSYQSEGDGKGVFHSGLYYGTRSVGRVELRGADGPAVLATLLELPGRPGWGVWYAYTPVTAAPGAQDPGTADLYLYDRSGRRLADLPGTHGNR
ncbi:hypothetical protein ACFY8W_17400 [Streptomyces sp. NPDC012637]|uniref:hypothetical protein n=1 Tax=Streptomyces sp. NPDC012637 TaxID=3364842 RepID=UPI0036E7BAFF